MNDWNVTLRTNEVDVMPWFVAAGDDGLLKDSILVAVMEGEEMVSVSLHTARPAAEESA